MSENDKYDGRGRSLYTQYQDRLTRLNACDFGDLLLKVVTLLQENEILLQRYQKLFKYILVDEYQDTNLGSVFTFTTLLIASEYLLRWR